MPNKPQDPSANLKKLHIGNDHVVIVYNNSGTEFNISVLKVVLFFFINGLESLELDCKRTK